MNNKQINLSHIPELDGIRGIAILLVMVFHIGNPIFKGGFIGVDIFFVLSGFLITTLLLKEYDKNKRISLKNFYMRRILRLAPALLVMLTILIIIGYLFFQHDMAANNLKSCLITLFYSSNWIRAFNLHDLGLLSHTWSLSIEEQFYILYPCFLILFLKLTKSRKQLIILLILLALSSWLLRVILTFNGFSAERIYNGLDTRADSLLTGCILGLILSTNLLNIKNNLLVLFVKFSSVAAILCFVIVLFGTAWSNKHVFYWIAFLIQSLTALLILHVFLSENSIIKKLLRTKMLVWIGSISYGLYLWHDPVYELLRMQGYSMWTISIFGISITFVVAALSFYLMERPVLRLKKKFTSNSLLENSFTLEITQNKKAPLEEGTFLIKKD